MIKPHGSETLNPLYVRDDAKRAELVKEAEGLPSIVVSSAAAGNAVMLGSGYFNPLTGYMNKADALAVAEKMQHHERPVLARCRCSTWSRIPPPIKDAKRIALRDPNVDGNPVHRDPGRARPSRSSPTTR